MDTATKNSIDIRCKAENDLVKLAVLMASGKDNTEDADRLRDNIGSLESQLSTQDVLFLRSMSSDLYMLENDEIYDERGPQFATLQQIKTAIVERYAVRDWEGMLTVLRQEASELPTSVRAWLRARAYEQLGSYAAAWAFFDYAAMIEPEKTAYSYSALYCLRKWNINEAKRLSDYLIAELNANAAIRLLAALTILSYYQNGEHPKDVVRSVAANLIPALGSAAHDEDVPRNVLSGGYGTLAICLDILGDYESAMDVYRIAASDDDIAPMRRVYELQHLISQSVPSGIVIDPASLISILDDREESFEDKATASVMQLLVTHA